MDDGFERVRGEERGDRGLERLPVAAGQIGATDRAGEQHVAREQLAVCEVGEVGRRVTGNVGDREGEAADVDRLASLATRCPRGPDAP